MHRMKNWDDLRVFLATARAGSARGGARSLGINQSTISRRIGQLEVRTGVLLFDRRPGGLALTDAGEELLGLASDVEERIALVDRRLQGRDVQLRGTVRLSLPDFGVAPVAPHIAQLYPQIEVEVLVDNDIVSLTHREANLVLRLSRSPPTQLVGRRISNLGMAVYGSQAYLQDCPRPLDVTGLHWVRWDETGRHVPPEQWIDKHVPPELVRARINTSLAYTELIRQGIGVGFQPCYTADVDPCLERVGPIHDFGLALWLLTHEDLKRTARVRALLRFLGDALAAERSRFIGAAA